MSVLQLSAAEREVVADYIRLGSLVAVAQSRGRHVKTIESQMKNARKKAGGVALVQIAVLVDRICAVDILAPEPFIPSTTPQIAAPSRAL